MSSTGDSHSPGCVIINDDDRSSLVKIVESLRVRPDFDTFWEDCERGELNEYCFCDKASSAVDVALVLYWAWQVCANRSWHPKAIVVSSSIQLLTERDLHNCLDFTVWYADRGFESLGEDPLKHRNQLASAAIYALPGRRHVVFWTFYEQVEEDIAWARQVMALRRDGRNLSGYDESGLLVREELDEGRWRLVLEVLDGRSARFIPQKYIKRQEALRVRLKGGNVLAPSRREAYELDKSLSEGRSVHYGSEDD